ncbi:VlmB-like protein [Actinosynnema sp. ALI-1.44]|nr:VlmB-like protein [Actinosynnema sp. ALI-1.44]ONI76168.1 VlmB-like protein [Actinosynnema sp. ALI-1.44]
MTHSIPREADFDLAPSMLDGAMTLNMTTRDCDLVYWLTAVAQGTLKGRAVTGHAETAPTPEFMREPGPLREALILELGWRSVAEERAVRTLSYFVADAPGIPEMEFFATQVLDEARHSQIFRDHLVELGVPADQLLETIAEMSAEYTAEVLTPIEEFVVRTIRDEGDFVGAVAAFTIVVEGVLAPAAELSERKWDRLDPAAGEIARGAGIDEIRHLTVGSSIVREHLIRHPEYRSRVLDIVTEGRKLWDEVPVLKYVLRRENLFQEGMQDHVDLLDGYEVFPGRELLDTSPMERYDIAERWTDEMSEARLRYMDLEEATAILATNSRS